MKMVQFEMNLSVPAVPALAELLNCGPRSRLYNSPMQLTTYVYMAWLGTVQMKISLAGRKSIRSTGSEPKIFFI